MNQLVKIQVSKIKPDPDQPRQAKSDTAIEQLANSMREFGLINPIEVDEKNVIVTGESRWRAAKLLGWKTIEAKRIKRDHETHVRQLSENVIRKDMDHYDIARTLKRMVDEYEVPKKTGFVPGQPKHGPSAVAERLGMSRTDVVHYLQLLKGDDPEIEKLVRAKELPFRIASQLNEEKDPEIKRFLRDRIIRGHLRTWTLSCKVRAHLRATRDFKMAAEILDEGVSKKMPERNIERRFHDITPKLGLQLKQNLAPGQRLIAAMSALAVALDEVDVKNVAPIHYGRLLTTWTLLQGKVDQFEKALALAGPKEEENEHTAIQAPARQ